MARVCAWQKSKFRTGLTNAPTAEAFGASTHFLNLEQCAEPARLNPAHRNFGLPAIVHFELEARFEPGNHFADLVDVDQERAVHTPEKVGIEVRLQLLDRLVV